MFNFNIPFFGRSQRASNRSVLPQQMSPRTTGAVVLVLGIVFAAVGGYMVYDNEQTKNWPTTTATVKDVRSEMKYDAEGNSRTEYRYVLEYTIDQKEYADRSTSTSYVRNGQQKQIAYNPDNPNDNRLRSSGSSWFTWLFVALGGIMAIVGVGMLIKGGSGGAQPTQSPIATNVAPPSPVAQPTPTAQPPVNPSPTTPPDNTSQSNGPFPPSTPPLG
jgi:hypothetical protein